MRGLAMFGRLTVGCMLVGCTLTPLPAASHSEISGCHPGAYGALSELRCQRDTDCLLCGAETGCGELTTRRSLALTNAPCPRPDARACQGRAPACCAGRCVVSLGPPPL